MTNKERYRNTCEEHYVQLFAQPWWLDAVCAHWDVAITAKGDHIAGAWPYPVERKLGVSLLRTPMLTPYLGPQVFCPADIKESKADSFQHDTIAALIRQLPLAKFWYLSLQPSVRQAGLFRNHGLSTDVQQTFVLQLHLEEATLLANMKDTMRRNIRAAEAEMTITNEPALLSQLYKFQTHTLGKKGRGVSYSLAYLQRIMDACLEHSSAALWVAKDSAGQVQSIVWQVWDARCSYYLIGGQNPAASSYKAMSLLLWHAMKEAKRRGHSSFDLEGSMDEGVERFFRNFGGERTLYLVLRKNTSIIWKLKQAFMG